LALEEAHMKELAGKTAVVTGAASGIGRALAEKFAAEGMQLVLADHDAPALEKAAEALAATGARTISVVGDVARGEDATRLAARAQEAFGKVHILCNNAGVSGATGPMWLLSENDWAWTLGVNLWGVIHGIRAFVGGMIAHGEEAHVINTASIAGMLSPPMMGPYVASKHAVVALSETLARDLQGTGARVHVSVLCPAWVRTNIVDTERHRPRELANPSDDGGTEAVRQTIATTVRDLIASGMEPSQVAERVVEAVRAERFYILPHTEMYAAVENRFRDIKEDRYPRFNPDELMRKP
jgi:NAD(P)-dependent dehydrogenase (short-subunit alcohol dehydrogenase family)